MTGDGDIEGPLPTLHWWAGQKLDLIEWEKTKQTLRNQLQSVKSQNLQASGLKSSNQMKYLPSSAKLKENAVRFYLYRATPAKIYPASRHSEQTDAFKAQFFGKVLIGLIDQIWNKMSDLSTTFADHNLLSATPLSRF